MFDAAWKRYFLAIWWIAGLGLPGSGQVAEELNLKLTMGVYLNEKTDTDLGTEPYLVFPNLNKVEYFENERQVKRIHDAELDNDTLRLDSLLTSYIENFGIRNFRDDVKMLWLAGQTREAIGDTFGAMYFYEMGINHTRSYQQQMRSRYDSLSARWRTNWVNLDFYYKILEARRKVDPLIPPKGVMLNMGPKVNSELPDYAPFMHPSDSILIFTSRRHEDIIIDDLYGTTNEDLYITSKDWIDGTWDYAQRFSKEINSQFNEGSACLGRDGKTLIFARCDADDGFGSCDLYMAEFAGGGWINVHNLGKNVNSSYWDSQPNLSPDGKTLFFTSNREGGFGGSDVYYSELQDDGTWSQAVNVGPTINTLEHEVTPFFHQINNTLYFSSTGHLHNTGGYDIFKSRWLGDHWEPPHNLGPLVNGHGNEYYFSIDGKGNRLFYAMAKVKENDPTPEVLQDFNLYSFPMPMEARPDAIVTLRGYLMDSVTGNPLTGVVLLIDKSKGIEVAPKFINKYGYFEFDVINNHYYEIYVQGENFLTVKEDINMEDDTTFSVIVESIDKGKPLVFESMQFDENSSDLKETIEPKLEYIARFMKRYPMFKLKIGGHTDSDGDARYNLTLSRKRAQKIRKFIMARGEIDGERIIAQGFGETRPLSPNIDEYHKTKNRRVEFELYIDPLYAGDVILPMEEEFDIEDEELFDPEFLEEFEEDDSEFQWDDDEFEFDLDIDEELDKDLLIEFDDFGIDPDDDLEIDPLLDDDIDPDDLEEENEQ